MTPIFLIGYRCTGKTTTGKLLAKLMDLPFIDTDQTLESRFNTTIAQIVEEHGWEYFREKEKQILLETKNLKNPVGATGGGSVLDPENRKFMEKSGICVWLQADENTLLYRIIADTNTPDSRPGLTNDSLAQETQKMLELRTPLYEKLAQITINTVSQSPEEAANMIKRSI